MGGVHNNLRLQLHNAEYNIIQFSLLLSAYFFQNKMNNDYLAIMWLWQQRFDFNLILTQQALDTVGWATGSASCLWKRWVLVCWWWRFDCSFAPIIAPVVTTICIILSSSKSEKETFCYQQTEVHMEKLLLKQKQRESHLTGIWLVIPRSHWCNLSATVI